MKKLFSLILFAFVSASLAQTVVFSPQTIVVNPIPSFGVEVFVDKDPSGDLVPTYQVGSNISIGVRVTESSYVYLFNVKATGEITQIIPNRIDAAGQSNFVNAGETKFFPPRNARYTFSVDGPTGTDKVIALASKDSLDVSQLANFQSDPSIATSNLGEQGFAQTLSIIIRPKPQNSWVTDTAIFNVGTTTASRYGTLSITSSPSGAEAFVDGQLIGYTPVRFGTNAGAHTVEVRANGYQPFSTSVNVPGGQTTPVNATLAQVVTTGVANFISQPAGAQVFVDGNLVGVTPTGPITLNAGSRSVRYVLGGYADANFSINVGAGTNQTFTDTMRGLTGSLTVRANLGGARIFINGEEVDRVTTGTGVNSFSGLPAGNHELTVVYPGFRTHLSTFTIRSGETVEVQVNQVPLVR